LDCIWSFSPFPERPRLTPRIMAAVLTPFCSACQKDLPAFDLVLTTACRHLYCSDCIQRFDRCPIDAIAWGVLDKHDALEAAFQAYRRGQDAQTGRRVFALVNTMEVRCKLMGTRNHLKGSCPYSHSLADTWDCQVCGLNNQGQRQICVYCAAPQSRTPKFQELNLLPSREQATPYWLCDYCRFENGYETETCWGCMRGRPRANGHSNGRKSGLCAEMKPVVELPQENTTTRVASVPLRTGQMRTQPRSASPLVSRRTHTPVLPMNSPSLPRKSQYSTQPTGSRPVQPSPLDWPVGLTICALLGLLLYAFFN